MTILLYALNDYSLVIESQSFSVAKCPNYASYSSNGQINSAYMVPWGSMAVTDHAFYFYLPAHIYQMISLLVPVATFLPKILEAIGLPAATYLENKDEATGLSTCTVSLYFANDCGQFDDLRTFTASSLAGIINAKHLASLDAIQNLKR